MAFPGTLSTRQEFGRTMKKKKKGGGVQKASSGPKTNANSGEQDDLVCPGMGMEGCSVLALWQRFTPCSQFWGGNV